MDIKEADGSAAPPALKRGLGEIFDPSSIAVVGVSDNKEKPRVPHIPVDKAGWGSRAPSIR